jgi:hypothetical protein
VRHAARSPRVTLTNRCGVGCEPSPRMGANVQPSRSEGCESFRDPQNLRAGEGIRNWRSQKGGESRATPSIFAGFRDLLRDTTRHGDTSRNTALGNWGGNEPDRTVGEASGGGSSPRRPCPNQNTCCVEAPPRGERRRGGGNDGSTLRGGGTTLAGAVFPPASQTLIDVCSVRRGVRRRHAHLRRRGERRASFHAARCSLRAPARSRDGSVRPGQ